MEPLTPKARITLSDIAHRLNVSHTTVSRALRNDRQISKSLSQRIQRAAKQMGYRNVYSLVGGYKALVNAQWPMKSGG